MLLISAEQSQSQKMRFSGYSGGMMLQSGYVFNKTVTFVAADGSSVQNLKMDGFTYGIGGALRVRFGQHLRVGCEGYVSTLKYGDYGSYSKTGWGGVLADCTWEKKKWSFFVGGTIGGGSVKNLTLFDKMPLDYKTENLSTSYRKYAFMAFAPFAGVEYAISEKIHIIMKLDYLFNLNNPECDFAACPRIYIGIIFCHNKL